jgi:hypothetical protein
MGVIYKLKTEVKNFILEQKKNQPVLSCRQIAALAQEKFQIKVSKSGVNSLIKEAGLSLPVGRRRKKRRQPATVTILPTIEFAPALPAPAPIEIPKQLEEKAGFLTPQAQGKEPVKPAEQAPATILTATTSAEIPIELPPERECTGAILLKAADYLIGGSSYITEAIKRHLNTTQEPDLLAKTESLIYWPLFQMPKETESQEISGLWNLIGKKFSLEAISSYLNELQATKIIAMEILQIICRALQEIHCLKVKYSDGSELYLDGQIHTIWSTPYIPFDFSTTLYKIKSYIAGHFQKDEPLVFFTAPGYDIPTKEFFEFILSLESREKEIVSLTLCGNKLEEIEVIKIGPAKRRFFALGFWPWQFGHYREVRIKKNFKLFHSETLKKDLYIAETEVELLQPNIDKRLTLRGCALKSKPEEKIRLIILTNLPSDKTSLEELSNLYFNYWPNLEECFQDFSRKIELFTYTATARRFFFTDALDLKTEVTPDIKGLFHYYLMALDFYVTWHFLPFGYEGQSFSTMKERFYSLRAMLKEEKEHILVTFQPPSGYPYLEDLAYACRRVNEREIVLADGRRLWFLT